MAADRSEKARCHKSDMHVAGESHSSIVPKKPANKGGVPPQAESAEGRGLTKENTSQSLLDRTQRRNAGGTPNAARSRGLWGVRQAQRALCASTSAVRTVCGSSARTGLCGGWPVRAVPTASLRAGLERERAGLGKLRGTTQFGIRNGGMARLGERGT
jgi:hypothetical protein